MTIVLSILKIIGIILLVILGLLLLMILTVFFVPVRYRVTGKVEECVSVSFRISWLLGIIRFQGQYEDNEYARKIKLFGVPLKKKVQDAEEKPKRKPKKKTKKQNSSIIEKKPEISRERKEHKNSETDANKPNKRKRFFAVLKNFPGMIRSNLENLKEKAKNFKETAGRVRQEFSNEINRSAVNVLFRELRYLTRHVSPRRLNAEISFGMEDPAVTGQILGIISTLPFVYRYQLNLHPDFDTDKFYFTGHFDIKGHAHGIHAFITGYHLIRDNNIRDLLQRYRNS